MSNDSPTGASILDARPIQEANRTAGRAAAGVAALFFVNGLGIANFLPRIAEVRDQMGISNGLLGFSLLGGGLGGIIGSRVAARALDHYGNRNSVLVAGVILSVLFPLIAFAPSAWVLLLLLVGVGFFDVISDLAMNAQGVLVQVRLGSPIMNRLHGMWSLGFLTGSAIGLGASAAKIGIKIHLPLVGVLLFVTLASAAGLLIKDAPDRSEVKPAKSTRSSSASRKAQLLMAASAAGAAFLESGANDWSSVVLKDQFNARVIGMGTFAFAGTMLAGRMGGDHAVKAFGQAKVLAGAIVLTSIGASIVVLSQILALTVVGFAVMGTGVSVLFPQLYERAAHLTAGSAGTGLAAMTIGQRLGFMLSPFAVGRISDWVNLRTGLGVILGAGVLLFLSERLFGGAS